MSIGLLLEFIVYQERRLMRHKALLLIVTTKTPTELMPVFSAVAQWAEVVYLYLSPFPSPFLSPRG